jgi:hypothetical protein
MEPVNHDVKSVAARFGVSCSIVASWIRNGELAAINVSRSASSRKPRFRIAEAIELLLNEVMKIERTEERQGYANGFKDKSVHSRVGDLHLKVPQARDVDSIRRPWSGGFVVSGP